MYYEEIMEKLGFPSSELLRKILEYLMTPEEAKVAAALPGSIDEIAEKLSMDKSKVRERPREPLQEGGRDTEGL
jgi:uncharacterized protein with von Willebrand factor type A (vWA) domain